MKRLITTVLALSLLSGTAALAQPFPQNGNSQGQGNEGRGNQNRNDQNRSRDSGNNPGVRMSALRYSRGDSLPDQYRQSQYVVSDWRERGFRQPPRDYRWVRNDNNDYFLVSVSTWVIVETVYQSDRDQLWRQRYDRTYTYNDDVYYQQCRSAPDPAGILIGGLIGGMLGNAVGNDGNHTGTTIAGVIFGGAIGAALTSNMNCEDRSYAYKTYYDGFNSGRPGSQYQWSNPSNGHRGEVRVGTYYNDPGGFHCANFTQIIYIQGRAQNATGRACRQADGTWAIIQ